MKLLGKVAVVTGAGRGMGLSHARQLALAGAKVVFTDISPDPGLEVPDDFRKNIRFMRHDVTKYADWENVVAETETSFGPLSILVNNAGIASQRSIEDSSEADFRSVIDINQVSVFLGIKAASQAMRRGAGGSIINISSILGLVGGIDQIAYTASKFAIRGMTKAAAAELGRYGIRVNSVHPGGVDTAMTKQSGGAMDAIIAALPIARRATPDEVSNLVVYLASDDAAYSTGSEFIVDGGWTCQW